MHILLSNDDGPPSNTSSPYVHSLVSTLQEAGHTVSVVLPHTQRSWIGKAHMVGQMLTTTYFRPGTILKDDGVTQDHPFNDGKEEWALVDGTPASCVQLGLHHMFQDRGPVDLVLSGPNYGRNTTAIFALSSGTIGGAMEGAMNGYKAIALSYAFESREHKTEIVSQASRLSTKLIEKLVAEWPEEVHLYSINVPIERKESSRIMYTDMLQNQWTGSSFEEISEGEGDADPEQEEQKIRDRSDSWSEASSETKRPIIKKRRTRFKWAPNFADVRQSVLEAGQGDGYEVMQGHVSVTPLRANFWHVEKYKGEIKLPPEKSISMPFRPKPRAQLNPRLFAVIDYPDHYVQPLICKALQALTHLPFEIVNSISQISDLVSALTLQYTAYESLGFEYAMSHPSKSLVSAYIIRKALIRKHYLSNTISTWVVKHPGSLLQKHFKSCEHFELDYSEFLDDALTEAWDLNASMTRNSEQPDELKREWWILKPGMSDGGNGIRLFSNLEQLQEIFEEWDSDSDFEPDSEEEEDDDDDDDDDDEDGSDEDEDDNGDDATDTAETAQSDEIDVDEDTTRNNLDLGSKTREAGAMTSQLRHFIAQPYIDRPLLLASMNRKKFHIRTYVLAVGALRVYVYREMLALFAAQPYRPPSEEVGINEGRLAAHLTNTCFQDHLTRESSVLRFWALQENKLSPEWQEKVFSQICQVTGEVFEAAAREQMVHFQTLQNAFEVFGADFLVDGDLNVWLLELNAYPDFKQTGKDLQDAVVGGLFEEVAKVAVAPFFEGSGQSTGTEKMLLVRSLDLGRG